ncbi:hypothetical protein ACFX1S_012311 [Malus domestica]
MSRSKLDTRPKPMFQIRSWPIFQKLLVQAEEEASRDHHLHNAGEYEIDLQLNSPRSEISGNSILGDGFDSVLERKQTHNHVSQRVARGFLKRPIGSAEAPVPPFNRKKLSLSLSSFPIPTKNMKPAGK